ncbi:hypothetical protein FSP39_001136 [Pinctada imbricata]|uniref:Uncharacterized protein n=1 Tax=Pinctada imbricata TaxID=66713 RepID=A0AA89BWL5_PINIB|nr:hypothetical protein FSP39_001136 [Pinctada imbricata]
MEANGHVNGHENGLDARKRINGLSKGPMELYLVRINPACRVVWLYMLQHEIPHILIDVDFSRGPENLPVVFRTHPHQEVPLLVDGEVVVYEGPAILRYLSLKYTDGAGLGHTLKQQMAVESVINWANAELVRGIGYNYIYPQFLENYVFTPEKVNEAVVEKGLRMVTNHLEIIEKKYLARQKYLCGDRLTMADTCVAAVVVLLEWTGFGFKMWPKVETWLNRIKQQTFWDEVHTTHNEFVKEIQMAGLFK